MVRAVQSAESMMKLIPIVIAVLVGCGGKKSPADQCEAIYQKGDGEKPYAGDKTKFMEVCQKSGDDARRCLLLSGKDAFEDKSCGPGNGTTFHESMEIMQLGQGGK